MKKKLNYLDPSNFGPDDGGLTFLRGSSLGGAAVYSGRLAFFSTLLDKKNNLEI